MTHNTWQYRQELPTDPALSMKVCCACLTKHLNIFFNLWILILCIRKEQGNVLFESSITLSSVGLTNQLIKSEKTIFVLTSKVLHVRQVYNRHQLYQPKLSLVLTTPSLSAPCPCDCLCDTNNFRVWYCTFSRATCKQPNHLRKLKNTDKRLN